MARIKPIITLKNISRTFTSGSGETVQILKDLNLEIKAGSFNVIRGESGSGKTTLLRILGMLDTEFEGSYLIEGNRVHDQPDWYLDEMRAQNLGFIFQEGRLFNHMTMRRNIEIPLELHTGGISSAAKVEILSLSKKFFNEDEQNNATLELLPGHMSGGQKQRGSIMRAIANKPSIILADEPTASLHGDLKQEVVDHLVSLCKLGHTVIVVSHDNVFYDTGRQLELECGVLKELVPGPRKRPGTLAIKLPEPALKIFWGWRPRAPFKILVSQAIRETFARRIFLFLILVSLIVGVCQVSVFTSVIIGTQAFIDQKMTEGSRLNRIQIKPKIKDLSEVDRFPTRGDIALWENVKAVVPRRASLAIVRNTRGETVTYSAMGLHVDDPEYRLLNFVAGGPFTPPSDQPEVIITAALVSEIFDTDNLEIGKESYADFIGRPVELLLNQYDKKGKIKNQTPAILKIKGIILSGEGGRQLYLPNSTQLVFDRFKRDRKNEFTLPLDNEASVWSDIALAQTMANFPWEDSLHVYSAEMRGIIPIFKQLSQSGYRPSSDIWNFKWALDIQDTAWKIFLPLLALIILAVTLTVAANIFTSAKLRESELALWRVLGMRRGDLVFSQVLSTVISVALGTVSGLVLGGFLIWRTKTTLAKQALETAESTGEDLQNFDAIFAPVSDFYFLVIVSAIIIGILASLWPSIRTAKTDPAKVLQS